MVTAFALLRHKKNSKSILKLLLSCLSSTNPSLPVFLRALLAANSNGFLRWSFLFWNLVTCQCPPGFSNLLSMSPVKSLRKAATLALSWFCVLCREDFVPTFSRNLTLGLVWRYSRDWGWNLPERWGPELLSIHVSTVLWRHSAGKPASPIPEEQRLSSCASPGAGNLQWAAWFLAQERWLCSSQLVLAGPSAKKTWLPPKKLVQSHWARSAVEGSRSVGLVWKKTGISLGR